MCGMTLTGGFHPFFFFPFTLLLLLMRARTGKSPCRPEVQAVLRSSRTKRALQNGLPLLRFVSSLQHLPFCLWTPLPQGTSPPTKISFKVARFTSWKLNPLRQAKIRHGGPSIHREIFRPPLDLLFFSRNSFSPPAQPCGHHRAFPRARCWDDLR